MGPRQLLEACESIVGGEGEWGRGAPLSAEWGRGHIRWGLPSTFWVEWTVVSLQSLHSGVGVPRGD